MEKVISGITSEEQTRLVDDSIPFAGKHHIEYEYLSPAALARRFPLVQVADLHHAYIRSFWGYLEARASIQSVGEAFIKEGVATYKRLSNRGK